MIGDFFDAFFSVFGSGSLRNFLQNSWQVGLLIAAFIWGGRPEKAAIGIWVLASQLAAYFRTFFDDGLTAAEKWGSVNEFNLAVDSLMLIGFLALALNANRQYLIWVAALQIIATLSHAVRATTEELTVFVYLLMTIGAGWLQLGVMTGGLIAHIRRKRGVYPDWRWQVGRPAVPQPIS